MNARLADARWIQWSGLPVELNRVRAHGWIVFKTLMELDCLANRQPDAVECSLEDLGVMCGLDWEKAAKVVEALRKKKYLAAFVPDNPDEPGLYKIRAPIKTPLTPEQVALATTDPHLRDPTRYRYATEPKKQGENVEKIQRVVDLYLNKLSHRVNSFIVDEIEVLVERFPMDKIEQTIDRAARHEIRSIGWVVKELIRDTSKPKKGKVLNP